MIVEPNRESNSSAGDADEKQQAARPNELAKSYDPSAIEAKWATFWVNERLFDSYPAARDDESTRATKAFTMLLPPPNVTGRLHMGHMLNQAEMDILTRWHRMQGERALWVPGTDHAGIATQMMVEKQLVAEGTTRTKLGREAFLARVWEWKRQYGGAITDQMRRLGASVAWDREYFTMDEDLSAAVTEAFVRLYEQGLIYRGAYIVNWDPVAQTAVSDLEVDSEERLGKLYHVRYTLADGDGSIVIATTRPETMLGDSAVAVNPDDVRYKHLVGKMLVLPLHYRPVEAQGDTPLGTDDFVENGFVMRRIPIIADSWADPEFGTGAVKVTPAHDQNDFEIGKRHDLAFIDVMDPAARINTNGGLYAGLDRFEARRKIVEDLRAAGALVEEKDHTLTLPISQRTGTVIEKRLSMQWFLKIQPLADQAIAAVDQGHIKFTPENYRKTYDEWMKNIHDWCISRQLWWGHRIPAWHCATCTHLTVSRETPSACAGCGEPAPVQDRDVLDTWFSSGLLPFTVFGWPSPEGAATADMAAFYPTDLLVTGFDILFFWVARMIMLGTHFMLDVPMPDGSPRTLKDAVPFREVYIHALVRDADRQKMSKTKGNVINPIDIIERFGTDAVRFTLASMASPGTDISFSEERTEGYRAFANKIWNASRFLLMNLDRAREVGIAVDFQELQTALAHAKDEPLEAQWILSRLSFAAEQVDRSLLLYRFDEAANAVYQFFWGELCDWYLEVVKIRLDFSEPADKAATGKALTTLVAVFEAALRLLSPFMPFLTEEIWHVLWANSAARKAPAKSIALTRFPRALDHASDESSVAAMEVLQQLITIVRGLRKEIGVPEKEAAPLRLFSPTETLFHVAEIAKNNADILSRMARVSSVEITSVPLTGAGLRSTPQFDVQVCYERQIDFVTERERLVRELAKYEKGMVSSDRQLGSEAFIAKAPAHIIEGLRKQASETRTMYEKTAAALSELAAAEHSN